MRPPVALSHVSDPRARPSHAVGSRRPIRSRPSARPRPHLLCQPSINPSLPCPLSPASFLPHRARQRPTLASLNLAAIHPLSSLSLSPPPRCRRRRAGFRGLPRVATPCDGRGGKGPHRGGSSRPRPRLASCRRG
jgi:hypothetical protein